jgi:hypothetical protein
MSKQKRLPTVISILRADYIALLAALIPGVLWVMYIAIAYFGFFPGLRGRDPLGSSDAPFFFYGAILTTVVGLPILAARVRAIRALYARGVEVTGRVTNVWFVRDRGRVEYAYEYQGQAYQSGRAIPKSGRTEGLKPGFDVAIIVDPTKPERALVRDLYL